MSQDFRALRQVTAQDLPEVEQVFNQVRTRRPIATAAWKGDFMSTIRALKRRPLLAGSAAVAALALFLLVIPVSFQRTAGYEVTLTLAGPNLAQPQALAIARQLREAIRAEGVAVTIQGEKALTYRLAATVSARSGAHTVSLAHAFAGSLAAKGYSASVATTPKKEQVWGSVYAYAFDRVISISMDGKSSSQIQAEILQRLTEAGVPDAKVSVTDEPNGGQKVAIEVKRHLVGDLSSGIAEEPMLEIQLTKGGVPVEGDGFSVQVRKEKRERGMTLSVEVRDAGKAASATVPGADSMSDADVAAAIDTQLRQAGVSVRVAVTGGEVKIERAP